MLSIQAVRGLPRLREPDIVRLLHGGRNSSIIALALVLDAKDLNNS